MCVSINSEVAARRYVNELLRAYTEAYGEQRATEYVRNHIKAWQRGRGWLLDYDLTTCKRKPPVVIVVGPKPKRRTVTRPKKKLTGKPGMDRVREAVREVERTPSAPVKPVKANA